MNTFWFGEILFVIDSMHRRGCGGGRGGVGILLSQMVVERRDAGGGSGVSRRGSDVLGGCGIVKPLMMLELSQSSDGIIAAGAPESLLTPVHFQMTLIMHVIFGAVGTSDAEKPRDVTIDNGGGGGRGEWIGRTVFDG